MWERVPEPSIEPPYEPDEELWCDECEWFYEDDEGFKRCQLGDDYINYLAQATECPSYRDRR